MLVVFGPLWANIVVIVSWQTHIFRGGAARIFKKILFKWNLLT